MFRVLPFLFLLFSCYTAEPEEFSEYTVQRGDSLARIAKKNGVTVGDLREWNGIEGNLIKPGQILRIKGTPPKKRSKKEPKITGKRGTKTKPDVSLTMPRAKKCLDGPTLESVNADEGFATSQGLSINQLRVAMDSFLPKTLACAEEPKPPSGVLTVEITVACTGLVKTVKIMNQGHFSHEFSQCVTKTLRYASFPAHDMPDGFAFDFPLNFSF